MLRYSEASGPIARVTRCFGVPALKMFVLDDVNLCKTVACKIDVEHSRFHASRVRRSRMATQHDSWLLQRIRVVIGCFTFILLYSQITCAQTSTDNWNQIRPFFSPPQQFAGQL